MTATTLGRAAAWDPDRRVLTVGLIGLVTAVAFEGMAVPTVLPAMVAELGQLELYGWAFSAFWLTNIVGIAVGGGDADRHGPGRVFAIGVALFAVGLLVAGVADSMPMVIAGRAVQGLGSGAIGAVVWVVIARAYAADAMARMIAMLSSAWIVPGLIGPALAGVVTDQLTWRWVFLGLVPAVLLMGALVAGPIWRLGRSAEAGDPTERGSRVASALQLAAGSGLLLGALTAGHLLVAVPLVIGGGWLSLRALHRLLPAGSLLARHGRPAVVAVMFLVSFAFFGTEAFVPLAVTTVRGESTTVGGLALSAAAVTWAGGSWLPARVAGRGWRRELVGVGGGLIGIGIAIAALVLLPGAPVAVAALGWAIAGLGMGLAYSTLSLLILKTADPGQEGASSSALQLAFTLGTAFGAGSGGALVALSAVSDLSLAFGIALVNGSMLIAALLAATFAWRVPRGVSGPRAEPQAEAHPEPLIASPAGAACVRDET